MDIPPHSDRPWRLILDAEERASADGPTNMAVDQALLASVAAGAGPVLRLYRWSPATLSFGRNQPARGLYDEEAGEGRGIAFVRRPTGGQAVLHDDELTYAVVAAVGEVGKPRAAYRRINEALVAALRGLGVDAELAGAGGPEQEDARQESAHLRPSARGHGWLEACFRHPERGEIVAQGRKLVGSAQRAESRTILQHGSILLGGSQAPAEELLLAPPAAGPDHGYDSAPGWTTVEAEVGRRPSLEAVVEAVVSGFEDVVGISLARSTLTPEEGAEAAALRGRFESPAWTWRR